MKQKKNPNLKVAEPANLEKLKKAARKRKRDAMKKWGIIAVLAVMIIGGTYLLIKNQSYTTVREAATYADETSDTNRYAQFADGIVRYSRDGVVYLNRKNEEQWISPCQMQNPVIDVNEETFAVADNGGNSILVFTEEGLKGEIETTLPIEKMSVSNQGIVSVILKNENAPMIVSYDATGNVLVEHQVTVSSTGYPLALDISRDGMTLAVSYLSTKNGALKSKVAFYNFGEAGKSKTDNEVGMEEYDGKIIPEIYFMDDSTSVAVSDSSFIIYEGTDAPKKQKEVELNQEIKSVFHTDEYIGFTLLNKKKSGYEARLYNKSGKQIMDKAFSGEYSNIKMIKDEIIMFSGSKCCIITKNGVQRFKGDLKAEALEVIPTFGVNRYLVMSANELRVVYLTK
ncbi:hypothetical protein HGO97_019120 [Faecalicatena sp. AGMB00832]|uniref:Uncharacterized protein n=1 Tax=Faecalicatena faecalis TaxID=2726362 RepID=A0ABS6D8I9_9FIRM|nr:DUF5711 family protein [Faecalicatena faecalis]MBU3877918.1 hypothetical protein [Faecalicatena faecalis]